MQKAPLPDFRSTNSTLIQQIFIKRDSILDTPEIPMDEQDVVSP